MASIQRAKPKAIEQIEFGEGEKIQNGLAQLVLTVVEVVRQVMERQALKRVESGTLTDEEVERLGLAFMQLNKKMTEMSREMGIKPEDLRRGLGSIVQAGGKDFGTGSLVDLLDRLLDRKVVVAGQVKISVAEIDLVGLDLFAMLYPIYGVKKPDSRGGP
jgi:Gas vesicle protein K/Gas vesicle protein